MNILMKISERKNFVGNVFMWIIKFFVVEVKKCKWSWLYGRIIFGYRLKLVDLEVLGLVVFGY